MKKNINFIPDLIPEGKVTVFHAPGTNYPKLHIDSNCDAIKQIPQEILCKKIYSSTQNLAKSNKSRTCRKCTLEKMLLTLLLQEETKSKAFITFSSQAKPDNPDSNLLTYNWSLTTETGIQRLRKLAQTANLETINTSSGPVAFGTVNYSAAKAISQNLRSVIKRGNHKLTKDEVLCTWVLLNDNPPELAKQLQEEYIDAISTAKNLLK